MTLLEIAARPVWWSRCDAVGDRDRRVGVDTTPTGTAVAEVRELT
jgi:hypothetical protein